MNNLDVVMRNFVGGTLIFLICVVIIFLVFREVICWYWKINQNIALLTEIRDLLVAKGALPNGVASVAQQSPQKIESGGG